MGMYTKLEIELKLENVPNNVLEILEWMLTDEPITSGKIYPKPGDIPNHPFFKTERWAITFMIFSYHDEFDEESYIEKNEDGRFTLKIVSAIKNYNDEQEKLLLFLSQYIIPDEIYVGYQHPEWLLDDLEVVVSKNMVTIGNYEVTLDDNS